MWYWQTDDAEHKDFKNASHDLFEFQSVSLPTLY